MGFRGKQDVGQPDRSDHCRTKFRVGSGDHRPRRSAQGPPDLYKKLKLLFRVLLVTLLFLFPFLFFLFIGIKEEILWMIVLFGALLSIYAALIIQGILQGRKERQS